MKKIAITVTLLMIVLASIAPTMIFVKPAMAFVASVVHLQSRQDNSATSNFGSIVFDGTSYSLPHDIAKGGMLPYPVQYNPATGYEFASWQTSGGVSVADSSKSSTSATIMGNGTLRAIYRLVPRPTYDVNLMSRQDDGSTVNLGTIAFDGSTYYLPTATFKWAGTYLTGYNPAPGYEFVRWETSGGITVADFNSQSTSATVSGGGVLTAIYTNTSGPIITLSPEVSTGQTFKVDIEALNVTDLYAWEAKVAFDPTIMAAKSFDDGGFLGGGSGGPMAISGRIALGSVELNQTLVGDVPGVNGSGVLATITFGVIKPENSTMNLTDVVSYDSLGGGRGHPSGVCYFIPTHDIAVKSVTAAGLTTTPKNRLPGTSLVYPGWPVKVIISNLGNYNESDVSVSLVIVDENLGIASHYKSETLEAPIPPEIDDTIDFVIPYEPDLGDLELYVNYTVKIEAKATPVPPEIDPLDATPDNNVCVFGYIMIAMPGDVTCDKTINILDISAVATAFGSTSGQPRYNTKCDIDCNGSINILDIAAIAGHFGRTY